MTAPNGQHGRPASTAIADEYNHDAHPASVGARLAEGPGRIPCQRVPSQHPSEAPADRHRHKHLLRPDPGQAARQPESVRLPAGADRRDLPHATVCTPRPRTGGGRQASLPERDCPRRPTCIRLLAQPEESRHGARRMLRRRQTHRVPRHRPQARRRQGILERRHARCRSVCVRRTGARS